MSSNKERACPRRHAWETAHHACVPGRLKPYLVSHYWTGREKYFHKVFTPVESLKSAQRLCVPVHEPIAKYRNTKGNTHFITDFNVKTILQDAAREAMGIKDKKALAKWTCRSLRVTAANELHRLGFSDVFIKHRIRWRSDTFQMYLRHTVHAAKMHTKSISLCDRNLRWGDSNLKEVNARMQGLSSMRPEDNDRVLWSLTTPQA